jgi:hypothetical protein
VRHPAYRPVTDLGGLQFSEDVVRAIEERHSGSYHPLTAVS